VTGSFECRKWNIPEQKLDQKYGLDIKPVYIPGGVV
jgi:hypothetical protein